MPSRLNRSSALCVVWSSFFAKLESSVFCFTRIYTKSLYSFNKTSPLAIQRDVLTVQDMAELKRNCSVEAAESGTALVNDLERGVLYKGLIEACCTVRESWSEGLARAGADRKILTITSQTVTISV